MQPLHVQLVQNDGVVNIREPEGAVRTIAATGDMAFHGATLVARAEHGPGHLFTPMGDAFRGIDLTIGNLESVHVAHPFSPLTGRACLVADVSVLSEVADAGFDIMTFANNHICDAGASGIGECLSGLATAGLTSTGAGMDAASARVPATWQFGGQRCLVFAYSYGCGQIAGAGQPGCNEARIGRIQQDIEEFAAPDDLLIVALHMDAEFEATPAPDRVAMCRKLAEAGVHIVVCHHPHVPQGIEVHQGSLIAYSLGNFVFPMTEYLQEHSTDCDKSFYLVIEVDARGPVAVRVEPVQIEALGRPVPATGDRRRKILSLIAERSRLLDSPRELRDRYHAMTRVFAVSVFKNIYWAIGERDWPRLRLIYRGLKVSATHRKWIAHYLLGSLRFW